ncbi:MAG: InlB B-repeat-containing protein [Clostridia bacterium]|nr:InlB B-repeat-containing protein [Clostridia bacterium]
MKKKIIALMLVVCIMAVCFVGCDEIFKKNDQRDFQQAIATVQYTSTVNGQTSTQSGKIMKGEFALSFNNNAYYYVQYYGLTYSQAGTYIINSLAQRELMTLFAKAYVITNNVDGLEISKLPENCTVRELLTAAEVEKAIKSTNDDLKEALDKLIAELIAEDEKNAASTTTPADVVEDSSDDDVTYKVIFDSDGGTAITTLNVGEGKRVAKPTDPTKDGYTFGGWEYFGGDKDGEWFDFSTDTISVKTTLKAVWYEYTEPRALLVAEEEVEEEEFDPLAPVAVQPPYFFSSEYQSRSNEYLTFEDENYWNYLSDAIAQLKKNLASTYRDYDYYLESQLKTVLLEKFERDVYAEALTETGYAEKVQAEYERVIAQNEESFAMSDTNYETALKDSLSSTYYHPYSSTTYGFTNNILLRFSDENLATLTSAIANGTATTEQIKALRDNMAQNMNILVSNPDYDTEATCDEHTCDEDSTCDPMTCPNHACNSTPDENLTEDYNHMISFEYSADEGWHVAYNVTECATMAYLKTEWPAFTTDEKIGVVNQIKATLDAVVAATSDAENAISYTESIYWIRKVTEAWLYLVGDDSGGTSTDSNNGGLGYLISAEGESGYINEYETQARSLIALGTGSYSTNGTVDGFYVVGDNCIDEKTSDVSTAYAGIFIIVVSEVPYDTNFYTQSGGTATMENGILPLDYVVTVAKDDEDNVTIYDTLYDSILEGRKSEIYSILVNQFMNDKLEGHSGEITVDEDVYNAFFAG